MLDLRIISNTRNCHSAIYDLYPARPVVHRHVPSVGHRAATSCCQCQRARNHGEGLCRAVNVTNCCGNPRAHSTCCIFYVPHTNSLAHNKSNHEQVGWPAKSGQGRDGGILIVIVSLSRLLLLLLLLFATHLLMMHL